MLPAAPELQFSSGSLRLLRELLHVVAVPSRVPAHRHTRGRQHRGCSCTEPALVPCTALGADDTRADRINNAARDGACLEETSRRSREGSRRAYGNHMRLYRLQRTSTFRGQSSQERRPSQHLINRA